MVGKTSDCEPEKVLITALPDNLPPNTFSGNDCITETEIILDGGATITPVVLGSFCKEKPVPNVGRCSGLCGDYIATQLVALKKRRLSSSLYLSNLAAITSNGPQGENDPLPEYYNVNWRQSSDRNRPSVVPTTSVVPTRGNSLRSTITRLRPGAMQSGGSGVDVKHNSYHRYLNRLKGQTLRGQWLNEVKPPCAPSNAYAWAKLGESPANINDGICVPLCPKKES